ncbi:hypothetical protein AGMMS50276_30260 [Synergistales bacterium]|nr:hypothetical protein AGMMS50276_30260 [Synergistales bacterium]
MSCSPINTGGGGGRKSNIKGDIFVQKAPATTIGELAATLCEIFCVKPNIRQIGTRHGEKLYESLLTREEMSRAEDLSNYYRIPSDNRDLNYGNYFVSGTEQVAEDYTSHNTHRLTHAELRDMLLNLDYIRQTLNGYEPEVY